MRAPQETLQRRYSDLLLALRNSVTSGNLREFQNNLHIIHNHGNPLIDLNHTPVFSDAGVTQAHLLPYLCSYNYYYSHGSNFSQQCAFLETVLNLRNADHNPTIDINIADNYSSDGGRSEYSLLKNIITNQCNNNDGNHSFVPTNRAHQEKRRVSRYLITLFLDQRKADGTPVICLKQNTLHNLINAAVDVNDEQIVRALLDLRNRDGNYLYTRDYLPALIQKSTRTHGLYINNPPSREVEAVLRRYMTILPQVAPQVVARRAPDRRVAQAPRDETQVFNLDRQNTHNPYVTQSGKASVATLSKWYSDITQQNLENSYKECLDFLAANQCDDPALTPDKEVVMRELTVRDKQASIKRAINVIKQHASTVHTYSNTQFKILFAWIWRAINNTSVSSFPEELKQMASQDMSSLIRIRKLSLLERLIEADYAYQRTNEICAMGLLHKMIEALNKNHVDIVIVYGLDSAIDAARGIILDEMKIVLEKESFIYQKEIIADWYEDSGRAADFRNAASTRHCITQKLDSVFGALLTEEKKVELLGAIGDLPRPKVDVELIVLLESMDDAIFSIKKDFRHAFIKLVKEPMQRFIKETASLSWSGLYQQLKDDNLYNALIKKERLHEILKSAKIEEKQFLSFQEELYASSFVVDSQSKNLVERAIACVEESLAISKMLDETVITDSSTGIRNLLASLLPVLTLSSSQETHTALTSLKQIVSKLLPKVNALSKDGLARAIADRMLLEGLQKKPINDIYVDYLNIENALQRIERLLAKLSFENEVLCDKTLLTAQSKAFQDLIKNLIKLTQGYGNPAASLGEKIAQELNRFKNSEGLTLVKQCHPLFTAWQILKNCLMVMIPVLGWGCLYYRYQQGQTFFSTQLPAQSAFEELQRTLDNDLLTLQSVG